jgi:MFS family permease
MTTKKNITLIIASMGIFVESLDISIINLTIPTIQRQFEISETTVQWLQTLYVLFYGGFLIIGGKLSDTIGKRKIFIYGSVIFLLTSLGAGLSGNFLFLAIFRALQGFGAALLMPSSLAIVTHTFSDTHERSKAMGVFSSFASIGSGSGLALGGIISTFLGWHWVFLINVPVLLMVLAGAYIYLDGDQPAVKTSKTDYTSGVMLFSSLLLISFGVHHLNGEQLGTVIMTLLLALVILVFLYKRLKTISSPLIKLSIFKPANILAANGTFAMLGAFFTGFMFLISLVFQQGLGYSAAKSGLLLVPFSILSAITAKFIIPVLLKRLRTEQIAIVGMSSMTIGGAALLLAALVGNPLYLLLLAAAFISGTGMAIAYTSLSILGLKNIPSSDYGLASSLSSTCYFMGAGIGLSGLTLFIPEGTSFVIDYKLMAALEFYAVAGLIWTLVFTFQQKKALTASVVAA